MAKDYKTMKAMARNEAIDWQCEVAKGGFSYYEIQIDVERFERLGKRYGLTREFRENGII